ncbi:hypothetical protein AVEN_93405-1 [Araneus ventricosus]|uniref:CCHC-type domain-containing protein n=1 Tax=Araneus ventricosus TaxID=182803 RepID=A0A4Y2APB3_ARAVE|nr:hypothetical protein AVEN_93405-1 [Araneus ventricosus]
MAQLIAREPEEVTEDYEQCTEYDEKEDNSYDHKEKYSSFKEKNSAHVRGATKEVDEYFERKKEYRCYHCSSAGHFRSNCPQLTQSEGTAFVNWIISAPDNDLISPYTVIGEVNGFRMRILRDAGTTVVIASRTGIRPEMLTGEQIWFNKRLMRNLSAYLCQK